MKDEFHREESGPNVLGMLLKGWEIPEKWTPERDGFSESQSVRAEKKVRKKAGLLSPNLLEARKDI